MPKPSTYPVIPVIYLAGPVSPCEDIEKDWKTKVTDLTQGKWQCISQASPITNIPSPKEVEHTVLTYIDCITLESSGVLVYLDKSDMETAIKISIAHAIGRPVIVVSTIPLSPWISYYSQVFPTLEDGIHALDLLLEPKPPNGGEASENTYTPGFYAAVGERVEYYPWAHNSKIAAQHYAEYYHISGTVTVWQEAVNRNGARRKLHIETVVCREGII